MNFPLLVQEKIDWYIWKQNISNLHKDRKFLDKQREMCMKADYPGAWAAFYSTPLWKIIEMEEKKERIRLGIKEKTRKPKEPIKSKWHINHYGRGKKKKRKTKKISG